VNHYLPYFRQWLICHLLSAGYFHRLCLLKVLTEFSSLSLPPSLVSSKHPALSAMCTFQFFIIFFNYYFFFLRGRSLSWGLCWFIPGVAVGITHVTYLLTCWSASPKQAWSRCLVVWEPSCFLSYHGIEKLCTGWGFEVL
jgi:hypothetical protein